MASASPRSAGLPGTGCLGFSLRATTITAGVITLVESAVWTALSVAAYAAHACTFAVPKDLDLSLRLTYILYFLNTKCQDAADLTPSNHAEQLKVDGEGEVYTSKRTAAVSSGYIALSSVWFGASILLLATLVGRPPGRIGARLCFPWMVVTAVTLVADLVAMGFYAADAAEFNDVQRVAGVSNVRIPPEWLGNDAALALKAAPLLLVAVALRGVVLWLLNGVLLVHVGRAVRVMQTGGTSSVKPEAVKPGLPPVADEPEAHEPRDEAATIEQQQEQLGADDVDEVAAAAIDEGTPAQLQGQGQPPQAATQAAPALGQRARPDVLGPSAVAVLPALPVGVNPPNRLSRSSSAKLAADLRRPGGPARHGRDSGRSAALPPDSPRLLGGRLSDRMSLRHSDREHRQPASKEELVHRFERMSHLRRSGRDGAVSPAIESKISKIMRGSTSSAHSERPRGRVQCAQTSWEYYDGFFPEDDVFEEPYRNSPVAPRSPRMFRGTDYPTARPRQVYEFEDAHSAHGPAARRHHIERTRTQSDRAFGEWKMGQRPPGNLHGLSPLHGIRPANHGGLGRHADPGHGHGQEATEELKKELPWSYLRSSSDPDAAVFPDRDPRSHHAGPSKVMHSVYLPPGSEDEFHRSSVSGGARRDQFPKDVLY